MWVYYCEFCKQEFYGYTSESAHFCSQCGKVFDIPINFIREEKYNMLNDGLQKLKKVPQLPQTQESLNDQLEKLWVIASRFGLYDASDYIKYTILKKG